MDTGRLTVLVILAVVVLAVVVWLVVRTRRREQLRARFGPEYGRAVRHYGSVTRAESALQARQERVRRFEIRPLDERDADRFAASWRATQARFVDDPEGAIGEADRLVQALMKARGYPVGDFEQRVDDISVDHASVVEHYRAAHTTALAAEKRGASTEDLRQAMIHYRALFEDLLEVRDETPRRMEAGR
jgi:hypothetical protein